MIDRLIQSRPHINAHRQRRALCMLAVGLEVYSRNEMTEEEALKVIRASMRISEQDSRELLDELYGSILRRTGNGLAFQMRSYGEYLAAEELEREDLNRVRELAFFDHNTPNDSWMNAISYLVELNPAVRKFFVRKFPSWVLQSSPAAFSETEKTGVATGILEEFRRERQYLRIDPRVRIRYLARFITPEVEAELKRDLASADEVLCGNALVLLGVLKRPEALAVGLPIAKDRARGPAIRQCAMIALANVATPTHIPELVGALTADDPIRNNFVDAIGAITDAAHLPQVLDLVLGQDAMLGATYYHCRELRSREALVEVLRYLAHRPQELNSVRIDGYIEPILQTIPEFFDAEIASLCVDILRAIAAQHFYADRDGPLRILLNELREADAHGEVARLFFEREPQSPHPEGSLFFTFRFVASIATVETTAWLIRAGATAHIQSLAGFVTGPVRELLRPHSAGVIDTQDENARRYAKEQEAEERKRRNRIQKLQDRLLSRTKLADALNDFAAITEERWPELPEAFAKWLSDEINALIATLDLEHRIRWEEQALWTPTVYPLLMHLISRYELRVQPDELMVFPVLGMDEQRSLKYFQRYGFGENATKTLERLLATPPCERGLEGLLRFVRDSGITSDAIGVSLRAAAVDRSKGNGIRTEALRILAARGESDGLFTDLCKDPDTAVVRQAFMTLIERQHRATIERELSRLLKDDDALRTGEVEIGYDSPLSWIDKIRAGFAWDKLKHLRERALRLELDRVTILMTGALARIDRPATAKLIQQQLNAAPAAWRHFLQASAVEMEQAARIEEAQQTPFDAVLRRLRGSTSADKLLVVCEGPTDVPVFQALVAQLPDVPEVIFDWVGGWGGLVNKDPYIFLLGAKEAIVVMDGDNGRKLDAQPPPLTDLAREQTARLRAAGVELRILERYGIENYFPRQAVEMVLQRDLASFFPLPHNVPIADHLSEIVGVERRTFYPKSRNRDVVAHIDLDRDLAGSDLRTFIYEIAERARNLAAE